MITSCYKITVDQFCDCLFEKQYELLGEPAEQRQDAWNKIYVEYCDLMNDASYNESFNLMKEMQALNAKIHIIGLSIDYLHCIRDEEIEKILYRLGVKPSEDFEQLQKDGIAEIKKLTANLTTMQKDFDKLTESTGEKAGRDSFENNLLIFGEHRKIHLSATTTTMYQFCRMYKEFERMVQDNALKAR